MREAASALARSRAAAASALARSPSASARRSTAFACARASSALASLRGPGPAALKPPEQGLGLANHATSTTSGGDVLTPRGQTRSTTGAAKRACGNKRPGEHLCVCQKASATSDKTAVRSRTTFTSLSSCARAKRGRAAGEAKELAALARSRHRRGTEQAVSTPQVLAEPWRPTCGGS